MTENVGKVNFGDSYVSYFSLIATLGITTYAIRECAKVRDDKRRLEEVASSDRDPERCNRIYNDRCGLVK